MYRVLSSRIFFYTVILILFITTVFWGVSNAMVVMDNADALVDPYLFGSAEAFKQARFPEAHTFLVKWPLFWLISVLGYHSWAYIGVTVTVCLLTVGGLAYLLYRLERRRPVISALLLLLAASLMLVPPEPYLGALLPVNMAMLASRNLEFLLCLGAVVLAAGARSFRSWRLVIAWLMLTLLFASDGLFVATMVVGGAAYLFYVWVRKRREVIRPALRWLVIVIAAVVAAKLLVYGIRLSGVTQIIGTASIGGPYGLLFDIKNMTTAVVFALTGTLTVLGANPIYDMRVLFQLPPTAIERLTQPVMVAYVATGASLMALIAAMVRVRFANKAAYTALSSRRRLVRGLLITTCAAVVGAFVVTDHYYAADSRYLSLLPFVIFVVIAISARAVDASSRLWAAVAAMSLIAIGFAVPSITSHPADYDRLTHSTSARSQYIMDALSENPVDVLVGDYWRVLPIKQQYPDTSIMPMENCVDKRGVLTTGAWEHDLSSTNFAYLLTLESQSPATPSCKYEQVVKKYGVPNSTVVIAGTPQKPIEMLLIYEKGRDENIAALPEEVDLSPLPKALKATLEKDNGCDGRTTVSVIAHQDDDLLFMNPTLMKTPGVASTACIRTIYITAGDAGNPGKDAPYWLGRERGAQAAYASMFGFKDSWTAEPLDMGEGSVVSYASPRDPKFNERISLVFLRLPDGNIDGSGFPRSDRISLAKLARDPSMRIKTVDGNGSYTREFIVDSLAMLLDVFRPDIINTQATDTASTPRDHSDHIQVGHLTADAVKLYSELYKQDAAESYKKPELIYYRGYPAQRLAPNVSRSDLTRKEEIFMEYARYDKAVCQTIAACYDPKVVYGRYLQREYRQ